MTQSSAARRMSTRSAARLAVVGVVIAVLAAGAILFAPAMFADSSVAPAASNAEVVSGAWSDAGTNLAALAANARPSYLDAGASRFVQALAAEQLRNAAPDLANRAVWSDAGASAPAQSLAAAQLRNVAPASAALAGRAVWSDAGASVPASSLAAAAASAGRAVWSDAGASAPVQALAAAQLRNGSSAVNAVPSHLGAAAPVDVRNAAISAGLAGGDAVWNDAGATVRMRMAADYK